jgi:Raf kinase inhibitor-like YbhB/YbcL family protein
VNGSGRPGYTGPCPPKGGAAHHYQFTLYALDAPLTLEAGKTKDELEQAVKGHILATAQLTGLFAH